MFRTLFKKEILENIRNHRFLLALALCLTLVPLGLFVQYQDYQARDAAYRNAVRTYEDNHKLLRDLMWSASVFRPASPLSPLSAGIEALLPTSIETVGYVTEQGAVTRFNNSAGLGNPFRFLYGPLDLSAIVSVVISILAVLFVFNAVSGEKERRTLAQIFANAVPRHTLISAKLAAAFVLLTAAFLAGLLAGVLVLALGGYEIWASGDVFRPFLIAAGFSVLYIFVMVNLGLLVSIRARSSQSAAMSLIQCWVVLFMLVPKASVIASKILRPVKSQQVIDLEKERLRGQLQKDLDGELDTVRKSVPGIKDMTMDEFFKARMAKNPVVDEFQKKQNEIQDAYRARLDAETDKIDAFYEVQREGQTGLARNVSRLSPVSCFLHAITELSRTGLAEFDQLKRNRTSFRKFLEDEISRKSNNLRFENTTWSVSSYDWNAPAPKVTYRPAALGDVLPDIWPDIVLLFVYGILFFAGAYVSFLRYDLR